MPTIKLQWWLGNQMFQYAIAYRLSRDFDEPIILDSYYLESRYMFASWTFRHYELWVFSLSRNSISLLASFSRFIHPEIFWRLRLLYHRKKYIKDRWGRYIENFPRNAYLDWWFSSYLYFEKYENEIRHIFQVTTPITFENQKVLDTIKLIPQKSVSIHIRRGDYVTLAGANKWHWVCSIDYYEKAIAYIREKIDNPVFFIFSDDIAWCRENIQLPEWVTAYYIDHNGSAGHEDLRLMYSCDHHIIANSSFSWWWAYLGKNPERIVVAPKKWLQTDTFNPTDLIPPTWILL